MLLFRNWETGTGREAGMAPCVLHFVLFRGLGERGQLGPASGGGWLVSTLESLASMGLYVGLESFLPL